MFTHWVKRDSVVGYI